MKNFEGIKLNQNKICVKEGLRSMSKFLLNSMWGLNNKLLTTF
jgi:hypothetical protein